MNWNDFHDDHAGREMYDFAKELWPFCRSLTGNGIRETLRRIQQRLPSLQIHEVPSGTKAFDWVVPEEWNIEEAFLIGPDGEKIVDFRRNNLHVVGYSEPVDKELSLEELLPHLHSLPAKPNAIPYVTSYYQRNWGFCLPHAHLEKLKPGRYRAVIKSELKKGSLTYGDLIIPGTETKEIFFSTNICHPSLANNEISGPVVLTALAEWISRIPNRRYTYRIYFGPETIGAIVYMSRHLDHLKEKVKGGYVLTCEGDNRVYSFVPSPNEDTVTDKLTEYVLEKMVGNYKRYSYLDRGSDERQFCSPGADLPMVSVMRSKYGEYPEYHTSMDDLSVISPEGLEGALAVHKAFVNAFEKNATYMVRQPGEPQLGKRGLYPNVSNNSGMSDVLNMMNVLVYCDGKKDLLDISRVTKVDFLTAASFVEKLLKAGVIQEAPERA